ncbi:DUF4367 domain-containing protein [Cytobacillus sp. FJAT-54145]|uniref:DUF4367 domain-containing protein n=1 Tax=Cytobacillus spartinae TaxID=3299023 RepID=A0ABW6KH62_9BACI
MEKKFKEMKNQMLEGELSGFEFTSRMESNVYRKISSPNQSKKKKVKRFAPLILTAALITLFFTGMYEFVIKDNINTQQGSPDKKEEKPIMSSPSYVPEGYEFEHVKTSGSNDTPIYEHVFKHKENPDAFYIYRMQKQKPDLDMTKGNNIPLTVTLLGSVFKISSTHTILLWEDEGYYQMVEQQGDLSDLDFIKIADSILKDKGYTSYLENNIEQLEDEQKNSQNEQTIPDLSATEAIDLLDRYEESLNKMYDDIDPNIFMKFKSYESLTDLLPLFTDFMDPELVENVLKVKTEVKSDGLYAIAMDGPLLFDSDQPYQFEKNDDHSYTLVQQTEDELRGKATLRVTFSFIDGNWKITDMNPYH